MDTQTSIQSFLGSIPEWQDENKRKALFSSVKGSSEDMIMQGQPKLDFWRKMILYACQHDMLHSQSILAFDASKLTSIFKKNDVSPMCFPFVISQLCVLGDLVPADAYLKNNRRSLSEHAFEYFKSALKFPVLAGSKIYSLLLEEDSDSLDAPPESGSMMTHKYIFPETVAKICKRVLSLFEERNHDFVDHCISPREFQDCIIEVCNAMSFAKPSDSDMKLLIGYLMNVWSPSVVLERSEDIFKTLIFSGGKELRCEDNNDFLVAVRSVTHLKSTARTTELQILNLDIKIQALNDKIREYLNVHQNRPMALETIRRRKLVQQQQLGLQSCFSNLESILQGIRISKTNEEVLKAYQTGTSTLKNLLSGKDITAAATMDSLLEVLDEAKEFDEVLVTANTLVEEKVSGSLTTSDLEAELEELIQEKASQAESQVDEMTKLLESLNVVGDSKLATELNADTESRSVDLKAQDEEKEDLKAQLITE